MIIYTHRNMRNMYMCYGYVCERERMSLISVLKDRKKMIMETCATCWRIFPRNSIKCSFSRDLPMIDSSGDDTWTDSTGKSFAQVLLVLLRLCVVLQDSDSIIEVLPSRSSTILSNNSVSILLLLVMFNTICTASRACKNKI